MYGFDIKVEQDPYRVGFKNSLLWSLWDYSHPTGCKKYMYFASPDRLKAEEVLEFHIRAKQYLKGERKQYPKSEVLIYG